MMLCFALYVFQKTNLVGELNTDHISIGNWLCETKGVSRFIEVGEGISDGEDEQPQEIHSSMNNSNKLEDQPVGSDIEEEESTGEKNALRMTYTTTASGWVSKPPACLIEEIGEAALSVAE